jgi:hypothetical protein
MWLIDGDDRNVWSSDDGTTWSMVTDEAAFSERQNYQCAVFDGKMWVIAGRTKEGRTNEVWSSSDGADWTLEGLADFDPRGGPAVAVLGSNLWLVGGQGDQYIWDDAWYSTDAINWTRAGSISAFVSAISTSEVARAKATAVTFEVGGDIKLFVMGGANNGIYSATGINALSVSSLVVLDDTWYTDDGSSWTQVASTGASAYPARYEHTSVVYDDRIWIMGGQDGTSNMNDVWYFPSH